jgi:hypothetical protein
MGGSFAFLLKSRDIHEVTKITKKSNLTNIVSLFFRHSGESRKSIFSFRAKIKMDPGFRRDDESNMDVPSPLRVHVVVRVVLQKKMLLFVSFVVSWLSSASLFVFTRPARGACGPSAAGSSA